VRKNPKAFSKPIFPVILNEVKDLNSLKMRDSSLYMKKSGGAGLRACQQKAARDGRPTNATNFHISL
jgi:hypothetical protein